MQFSAIPYSIFIYDYIIVRFFIYKKTYKYVKNYNVKEIYCIVIYIDTSLRTSSLCPFIKIIMCTLLPNNYV